jgi:hypothetical protein
VTGIAWQPVSQVRREGLHVVVGLVRRFSQTLAEDAGSPASPARSALTLDERASDASSVIAVAGTVIGVSRPNRCRILVRRGRVAERPRARQQLVENHLFVATTGSGGASVGVWSGPSRLDYGFITGCRSAGNDVVSTRWRVNTSDPDSPWCEIVRRTVVPRANLASVAAYNLRVKAGLSAGSNPPSPPAGGLPVRNRGSSVHFRRSPRTIREHRGTGNGPNHPTPS